MTLPDTPATALLVHGLFLAVSLFFGGWFTGWVLHRLKLYQNADVDDRGAQGAGRVIGWAERFLVYAAVALQVPALLAVLVGLKTIVRYPEVRAATEDRQGDGPDAGRFAEYYLVGTLVSLAVGVACPVAAEVLLWLR